MWQRLGEWFDNLPARVVAGLFLLPFLFGFVKQFFKLSPWFGDFDTVACADHAVNQARFIYAGAHDCSLLHPPAYVYTPVCAHFFALMERRFGITSEFFLIGAIYCVLLALVLRRLLHEDGRLALRAPFLAGITAAPLFTGNISLIFHAGIFLLATGFPTAPFVLVPLVALAAIFKPIFVIYAGLFLFTCRPWLERVSFSGLTLATVAAYFPVFAVSDAGIFLEWTRAVSVVTMTDDRGQGVFALPLVDQVSDNPVLGLIYLIFATTLGSAALAMAPLWLRDPVERVSFGISVCILLFPRLKNYDHFTLPFGIAMALAAWLRMRPMGSHILLRVGQLGCLFSMLFGGLRGQLGLLLVEVGMIGYFGITALRMRRMLGRSWWDFRELEPGDISSL
jgi:hypothetical protein